MNKQLSFALQIVAGIAIFTGFWFILNPGSFWERLTVIVFYIAFIGVLAYVYEKSRDTSKDEQQ